MSENDKNLPEIDDNFIKIAEMKLKLMEEDYARTLAAETHENLKLKGKFDKENFNNINFINPKEEEISDEEEINDNNLNYGDYNMISDNESDKKEEKEEEDIEKKSDNEEWSEMQEAEIQNKENIPKKDFKIDVDKIKNIMAKIDLKPPSWVTSNEVWKSKLTEMYHDLKN